MAYNARVLAPWIPTRSEVIEALVELLRPQPDDVFYDLGCGDGRVAVAIAKKHGIRCVCIELREDLARRAEERAKSEGVDHLVEVVQGDIFDQDLSEATIVYMYLLASANRKLKPKLEAELRRGTIVISLDFPIPTWIPALVIELPRPWQRLLYVYVAGPSYEGLEARNEAFELVKAKIDLGKAGVYSAVAALDMQNGFT